MLQTVLAPPPGGSGPAGVSYSNGQLTGTGVPAISWSLQPTFVTTGQKFGAGALSAGKGTLPFIVANNPTNGGANDAGVFIASLLVKVPQNTFSGTSDFLQVIDNNGTPIGLRFVNGGISVNYQGLTDAAYAIGDGTWHMLTFVGVGAGSPMTVNYTQAFLDAANKREIKYNNSTYTRSGPAICLIDMTQMPPGTLVQELLVRNTDQEPVPSSPVTVDASHPVICHLAADGSNAAGAPTTTVLSPVPVDSTTITRNPAGALFSPNVAPFKLYFRPSTDGGNGSSLNAAMIDAKNHGADVLYSFPGNIYADVPVAPPDRFHLIGLGPLEKSTWNNPGAGVQINTGLNSATGCIDIVGSKPNPSTADGFISFVHVENIACAGELQDNQATRAGGPPRLVRVINAYAPQLHNISVSGDFVGGFYFENVWDWYLSYLFGNVVGFSDMHATADSSAIQSYTGRSFTAIETRLARSLGVPMMEIVSPNTNGGGQDTTNNKRTENLHFEGNAENAVAIMIRGGNANMLKFVGLKCELTQGNVPIIVADDVAGLRIEGLVHGAGNGYPFGNFGGTKTSDLYSSMENPGLMVLGAGCIMPQLDLTMSYQNGGAPLKSFVRCLGTEYPIIRSSVIDGIGMLQSAGSGRIILDGCGPVSAARVNSYPQRYIQDGKNNEIVLVGNSSLIA